MDPFIAIIEKLVSIVRLREENRKSFFNSVIEPLYKELEVVVEDYFMLFRDAEEELLKTKDLNKTDFRDRLKKRREEMLRRRIAVREMAQAIKDEVTEPKVLQFVDKVHAFFYFSNVVTRETFSKGKEFLELFDINENDLVFRDLLLTWISKALKQLENDWVAISQSYAGLKIYSLVPRPVRLRKSSNKANSADAKSRAAD